MRGLIMSAKEARKPHSFSCPQCGSILLLGIQGIQDDATLEVYLHGWIGTTADESALLLKESLAAEVNPCAVADAVTEMKSRIEPGTPSEVLDVAYEAMTLVENVADDLYSERERTEATEAERDELRVAMARAALMLETEESTPEAIAEALRGALSLVSDNPDPTVVAAREVAQEAVQGLEAVQDHYVAWEDIEDSAGELSANTDSSEYNKAFESGVLALFGVLEQQQKRHSATAVSLRSLLTELWEGVRSHGLKAPTRGRDGERLIHAYCGGIVEAQERAAAAQLERNRLFNRLADERLIVDRWIDATGQPDPTTYLAHKTKLRAKLSAKLQQRRKNSADKE